MDCIDRDIQTALEENKIQREQFEDRIIFMFTYDDIDWRRQETKKLVFRILQKLQCMQKDILNEIGHSSDQELKKSGTERRLTNQNHLEKADTLYSEEQVRWLEDL